MAKRSRATTKSLFEDAPRLLFATNRANILPVFSSGLVRGRDAYDKYYDDLLEHSRGRIPIWRGFVPDQLRKALTGGVQGVYPVIAELTPSLLGVADVFAIRADRNTECLNAQQRPRPDDLGYLVGCPVPISAVLTLHFCSHDDLDDFKAREFDNVLPMPATAVTEDLFNTSNASCDELLDALHSTEPATSTAEDFHRIDSTMGAIAMACCLAPPRSVPWFTAIVDALTPSKTKRAQVADGAASITTLLDEALNARSVAQDTPSVDNRLLSAAVRYLVASSPKDGWVESGVLETVATEAAEGATSDMVAQIQKWQRFVRSVASSEREADSLDDSGSIVRRALMLLILRHEPDRIIHSGDTSLRPGPTVRALAGAMAGLFHGYSRLSRDIKMSACDPDLLAQLATSWWPHVDKVPRKVAMSVRTKTIDATHSQVTVIIGNKPLVVRESSPDDLMMRLYYHAKNLGIDLAYDIASGGFVHEVKSEPDYSRTVLFEEAAALEDGHAAVRIRTTCTDGQERPIKLTRKDDAIHLLERNADPATLCRFAVDPKSGHVQVLVHQILDTMDSLELRSHVASIVNAAASFEAHWQQRPAKATSPRRKRTSARRRTVD